MDTRISLDLTLKRIRDLPTLPTVVHDIMRMTADEFTSAGDLVNVILSDQSLTANLLKVANSPIYGVPKRIESVRQAVVLLGFSEVHNIALSASVFSTMHRTSGQAVFDRKRFWSHSYLVAYLTREMYERPNPLHPATYFTTGLLHDIGKVVLDQYLPDDFSTINEMIRSRAVTSTEAETQVLGATHAEIGSLLLQRWRLPLEQAAAIRHHHAPWEADDNRQLATALYYADLLTGFLGYTSFADEPAGTLETFYDSNEAEQLDTAGLLIPHEVLAQKLKKLQKNQDWLAEALNQSALL